MILNITQDKQKQYHACIDHVNTDLPDFTFHYNPHTTSWDAMDTNDLSVIFRGTFNDVLEAIKTFVEKKHDEQVIVKRVTHTNCTPFRHYS